MMIPSNGYNKMTPEADAQELQPGVIYVSDDVLARFGEDLLKKIHPGAIVMTPSRMRVLTAIKGAMLILTSKKPPTIDTKEA